MLQFKSFLTEMDARQATHLTHLEDAVLEGNAKNAIDFLIALKRMFSSLGENFSGSGMSLSTKFDGAPAIYGGINPENGKFFVGSKSIFSRNAKLNYTQEDISRNHSGGLAEKLSLAMKYLPELDIQGIIHGDFMFSKSDLKVENIDGNKCLTFQPNTITYAVPIDSPIGKEIQQSKIGIVWHTSYHGNTMDDLKTTFDTNIDLRPSKNVWYRSNRFIDATGKATLTSQEEQELSFLLYSAMKMFQSIPPSLFNEISTNTVYRSLIMAYTNQNIRGGGHIDTKFMDGLVDYVRDKYDNNVQAAEMPETKRNRMVGRNRIMEWFRKNTDGLNQIFELQKLLVRCKEIFIHKFNQVSDIGTFMKTPDGYKVTNPEGFVVARSADGTAYKLVSRLEFSRNNFLHPKGWETS